MHKFLYPLVSKNVRLFLREYRSIVYIYYTNSMGIIDNGFCGSGEQSVMCENEIWNEIVRGKRYFIVI